MSLKISRILLILLISILMLALPIVVNARVAVIIGGGPFYYPNQLIYVPPYFNGRYWIAGHYEPAYGYYPSYYPGYYPSYYYGRGWHRWHHHGW